MSLSELHTSGGTTWMIPIDILAILCLVFSVQIILQFVRKESLDRSLMLLRHTAGLAFAWGAFATLVGFFQALGALEESKDVIPFPVICGGLKVALITVLYGNLVYFIFAGFAVVVQWMKK